MPRAFDTAVSMDACHYFGTDDMYLAYYLELLKPGAKPGIIVLGLKEDFETVSEHLQDYWEADLWTPNAAWRRHWVKTGPGRRNTGRQARERLAATVTVGTSRAGF